MALCYSLPVYQDVYQLVLRLFQHTKDFPREYKFTLGQDMKRDGICLVRSIYRANKSRDKRACLDQFLDDFEVLKFELRLCADLRLLTISRQAEMARLTDSIGRQITGWRNSYEGG